MKNVKKTGFNMLWMFACFGEAPRRPDERQLDFIAKQGFNFIRVPTDYRFWTKDFDYFHPNEQIFEYIDNYLETCQKYGLHMSLNFHRTPGYCINRNNLETDNLWDGGVALDAFVFLWETFAKRYLGVSSDKLSFDLLNEPPDIGEYGFSRDKHQRVMRRAIGAIRAIDPAREIVLNGIEGGGTAIPELADVGAVHSGRGYEPFYLSHHQADWCKIKTWPKPVYPGIVDDKTWDRAALVKYYEPWQAVEKMGVAVHIGEFGCFNKIPNDIALRWLTDLIAVFKDNGWGYSMWNFEGAFGIVNHGRPGTVYTEMDGFMVDKALLDVMRP